LTWFIVFNATFSNISAISWRPPVAWTNRITLVAIATRSDTGSHNRLGLIQSVVPPHYVCNWYIYSGCGHILLPCNSLEICKIHKHEKDMRIF
jgi:hypothetical protein